VPAEQLRKVRALQQWALGAGDDDVSRVCDKAIAGDGSALDEALDWYDAWSAIHEPSGKG
jgi:hypothetical protein